MRSRGDKKLYMWITTCCVLTSFLKPGSFRLFKILLIKWRAWLKRANPVDIVSTQLPKGHLTMCATSIRLLLAHIEAQRLVTSHLATHDQPNQIFRTVSCGIRRWFSVIDLLGLILECIGVDPHELWSSFNRLELLILPDASGCESNVEEFILGLRCPTCRHCGSSSKQWRSPFCRHKEL